MTDEKPTETGGNGRSLEFTFGSLFSGIGGIDLGFERAGMTCRWQSELNPYASQVLAKHWPHLPNLGDITTIEWSSVEPVDLICGGFPCQPVSAAGRQAGQADSRWLWPEFARCLRHLRPRFVVVENVPALLTVTSGAAAQEVFGDLAVLGYDTEWCRLSAAELGAPHLRRRIFIVAYPSGGRALVESGRGGLLGPEGLQPEWEDLLFVGGDGENWSVADAGSLGRGGRQDSEGTGRDQALGGEAVDHAGHRSQPRGDRETLADPDSTARDATWTAGQEVSRPGEEQRPGRRGSSFGEHWAVEPSVGRVADGVPARMDRLRCLGNAVVPQVAEWIGRRVLAVASEMEAVALMRRLLLAGVRPRTRYGTARQDGPATPRETDHMGRLYGQQDTHPRGTQDERIEDVDVSTMRMP